MIKLFCKIAHKVWVHWSNIRYTNKERFYRYIMFEDRVYSVEQIQELAKRMLGHFEYTKDGLDKLGDAICPPPYAYQQIRLGYTFKDDCDGFCSLMYNFISPNFMYCYVMSLFVKGGGHCVVVFRNYTKWYVLDYDKVYGGYDSLKELIRSFNETYVIKYKKKSTVRYNAFINYDYNNGKFKTVKIKEIEE